MKGAILGNPVEHSLSPQIYNYLFDYFGLDNIYEKNQILSVKELKNKAEELDFCNITFPYKNEAFKLCYSLDIEAKETFSVNTILKTENGLKGYNTDGIGFVNSIKEFDNINTILIIGTGSTAKSAINALKDSGKLVIVVNRSQEGLKYINTSLKYTFGEYFNIIQPDMIVNMTSVGLEDENLPFETQLEHIMEDCSVCIDIIYGKETSFMKLAKSKNKVVRDGKGLLLSQAILSFQIFTRYKFSYKEIKEALDKIEFI